VRLPGNVTDVGRSVVALHEVEVVASALNDEPLQVAGRPSLLNDVRAARVLLVTTFHRRHDGGSNVRR
jgi:hypothetical protein